MLKRAEKKKIKKSNIIEVFLNIIMFQMNILGLRKTKLYS